MNRAYCVGLALAVVLSAGRSVCGELPAVTLEKAIHAEETQGDLDKAINLYEQVIADAQAQRPYAAQAYYRLGLCYLKKGDKAKAVEKLTELVSRYADQEAVAENARNQLAKMKPAEGAPVVLRTTPACFQNDVSPTQSVLTVTFDREMLDGSWSWCGGGDTFPEMTGKPSYDKTKRICTMPAKLAPGHAYYVGINSPSHKNFKTPDGVPARRYAIVFATKSADGKPTPIPDDLLAQARSINAMGQPAASETDKVDTKPLKLEPAPWKDGEVMRFRFKTLTGMEFGTQLWSVEAVSVNGKPAWRVEQYQAITALDKSTQFSRVDAERDSFAPMSGLTRNKMGEFSAVYEPGRVMLTVNVSGSKTTQEVARTQVAYDNEQALYLIRRLPLAENYTASFDIFSVQGGNVPRSTVHVGEKRQIMVPAGTFECYKVDLAVFVQNVKALEDTLWITADKQRLLVKYDAVGRAVMELIGVSTVERGRRSSFEDKELGISMVGPADWQFVKNPSPGNYRLEIEWLPPELKAWAVFMVAARMEPLSAKGVAEKDIERLKGFFQGYAVRIESWKEAEIGGVPAATFAADYSDKGEEKVEYRTYLVGKSSVYWFVFRTGKGGFTSQKPEFDSLVGSFKGR